MVHVLAALFYYYYYYYYYYYNTHTHTVNALLLPISLQLSLFPGLISILTTTFMKFVLSDSFYT